MQRQVVQLVIRLAERDWTRLAVRVARRESTTDSSSVIVSSDSTAMPTRTASQSALTPPLAMQMLPRPNRAASMPV